MLSAWLLVPLLALPAASQQILKYGDGQLPTCAQGCQPLLQADGACVSAGANQKVCFCQSAYLTQQNNLYTDSGSVCSQVCPSQSDQSTISAWYRNYCAGVSPLDPQQQSSALPASSTTAAPTSSGAKPTSTGKSGSSGGSSEGFTVNEDEDPSWWSQHGRYIIMVIVLVIAFTIIIIGGVWWKKSHDRKVNRATDTPLPNGWGPNSNPHAYPPVSEKAEKSERRNRNTAFNMPPQANEASQAEKGAARRLKKLIP